MLVYNYDRATGAFLGTSQADPSPLEPGVYLVPADATMKAPPITTAPAGKFHAFDAAKTAWVLRDVPAEPEPEPQPEPEPLTVEQRIEALRFGVQQHMDATARTLGYDDIKTAVTYADEPAVPAFQKEGAALRAWRSLVWAGCYAVLAQWNEGAVEEPTLAELLDQLPAFALPE